PAPLPTPQPKPTPAPAGPRDWKAESDRLMQAILDAVNNGGAREKQAAQKMFEKFAKEAPSAFGERVERFNAVAAGAKLRGTPLAAVPADEPTDGEPPDDYPSADEGP
ncbi:MAG TPA: hypothetical protein VF765_18745, partial [Polyangiaceae bacterium]